jgi:putative endonuclease
VLLHQLKTYSNSFSARYNAWKLVYYECFHTLGEAIEGEKQLKAGSRNKKLKLIKEMNPEWKDLSNILDTL